MSLSLTSVMQTVHKRDRKALLQTSTLLAKADSYDKFTQLARNIVTMMPSKVTTCGMPGCTGSCRIAGLAVVMLSFLGLAKSHGLHEQAIWAMKALAEISSTKCFKAAVLNNPQITHEVLDSCLLGAYALCVVKNLAINNVCYPVLLRRVLDLADESNNLTRKKAFACIRAVTRFDPMCDELLHGDAVGTLVLNIRLPAAQSVLRKLMRRPVLGPKLADFLRAELAPAMLQKLGLLYSQRVLCS